MENQPYTPQNQELSSEWLNLSSKVRNQAEHLKSKTRGTVFADEASMLAADTGKLCDHLERIHRDMGKLITAPDENRIVVGSVHPDLQSEEVQREAVKIHRESHEIRPDFKDIIKALFMWQDDPVERAREKQQTSEDDAR